MSVDERIATFATINVRAELIAFLAEACNGWAFWHVETATGLVSIDALRVQIRAEIAASHSSAAEAA
jgi:hypothetical protein